jgi:ribonuclease E
MRRGGPRRRRRRPVATETQPESAADSSSDEASGAVIGVADDAVSAEAQVTDVYAGSATASAATPPVEGSMTDDDADTRSSIEAVMATSPLLHEPGRDEVTSATPETEAVEPARDARAETTEVAEETVQDSGDATPQVDARTTEAASTPTAGSGVASDGRAVNDPRVAPSPVGEVRIETGRITLFTEQPAPPVQAPDRNVPRASNDPRGPRQSDADIA